MGKIENFIVKITGTLLSALMFVMMADIFAAVVVRYVLHTALNFSEELGRYTFVWIVFIGMARCVAGDAHVALDLLPNALKGNTAKYLKTVIYVLCAGFFVALTSAGLKLCEMGGNGYICDVIAAALQKSCSYISQYFQTAWKKNAESNSFYHREIIEALVKHDTERAVEMLQKDILNVKEQIQENYSL